LIALKNVIEEKGKPATSKIERHYHKKKESKKVAFGDNFSLSRV